MTTTMLLPASPGVAWVPSTDGSGPAGWVPAAVKVSATDGEPNGYAVPDDYAPTPTGWSQANRDARSLVWEVTADPAMMTARVVVTRDADGQPRPLTDVPEVPVLSAPTATLVRHCFGCEQLAPADADACPRCGSEDLGHEPLLRCPACLVADDIAEQDSSIRWNPLRVDEDDLTVLWASSSDSHFDSDGYRCRRCYSPVHLPDGCEIADWS